MRSTRLFAVVSAVVVLMLFSVALFFSMAGTPPQSSTTRTPYGAGSFSAAAETVTAVYASAMVSPPTTSTSVSTYTIHSTTMSTTSSTSLSAGSASVTTSASPSTISSGKGGSYTYTPSTEVQVLSVSAEVQVNSTGEGTVVFLVQFMNIGNGNIYVVQGGGSGVVVNITSGSSILRQVSSPRCELVSALMPLAPGSNSTAMAPGCWSGYHYELIGAGTVGTEMVLTWTKSSSQGGGLGSISITADFALS